MEFKMIKKITTICLISFCFFTSKVFSENKFGLEVGWGHLPGLEDEAKSIGQELANELGRTVTLETDTGTLIFRGFGQMPLDEKSTIEAGLFFSGDIETKYTYRNGSVVATQEIFGFDLSLLYEITDGYILKGGFHSSELDGDATVSLGGASAAITTTDSGTSGLIGIETADDGGGWTFSLVYYEGIGGLDDTDVTLFSGKYTF